MKAILVYPKKYRKLKMLYIHYTSRQMLAALIKRFAKHGIKVKAHTRF